MKISSVLIILATLLLTTCRKEPGRLVPEEYSGWKSTTDAELNYPIPGHEEHYRKIFINSTGEMVSTEIRGDGLYYEYPDETMIIKEVYNNLILDADDRPVQLTVMIKDPEHPQSWGGWIWMAVDFETRNEQIISYEFCYDCHRNANENHPYGDGNPNAEFRDYVFFPYKK